MAILTFAEAAAEFLAVLNATFTGTWATIALNATTSPATNLYVSLHNAAPGNGGSQNTNETAYTNYARVAVARSSGGWTVTTGSGTTFSSVANAAAITFPACGATGDTLTHFGIGLASSGAGTLLYWAPIGPTAGPSIPFTCPAASPGVFTFEGYTPTLNDRVSIYQTIGSEGLPTGFTEGTVYYAVSPSGTTCQLATTSSGTGVNATAAGAGQAYKQAPLTVSNGITPAFGVGVLSLSKA